MHQYPWVDIVSAVMKSLHVLMSNMPPARANDSDTKTRAIFVLAAKKAPYYVYGNPFYDHAGFLNVHSVDSEGRLAENVQNAELDERSAIHGMVFDPQEEYLYSADMWANKIWTHKKVSLLQLGLCNLLANDCRTPTALSSWSASCTPQTPVTILAGSRSRPPAHTSTSSWKPATVFAST